MSLEALHAEIKQVERSKNDKEIKRFFVRHPILFALGVIYGAGQWFLRACLWTLALLLFVVGLKILWLAVQYMWGLV